MEYGTLRLRTSSIHRTADLVAFIRVVDDTYEALSALDDAMAILTGERRLRRPSSLYSFRRSYDYVPTSLPDAVEFLTKHRQQISHFIGGAESDTRPARDDFELLQEEGRLIIRSFRMNSPGVFEFIGSLNPLEVLRNYLNDRHKRRQDRAFREDAEEDHLANENERDRLENERARLENIDLADQIAYRRLDALQRAGVSKKVLRELSRRMLTRNLERLEDVVERLHIEASDKIEPVRGSGPGFPW